MLLSEPFSDASRRQNAASTGVVALLSLSLLSGCAAISGPSLNFVPPKKVEAATLEHSASRTNNIKQANTKPTAVANARVSRRVHHRETGVKKVIRGEASWYGPGFHGRKTASGEIFDQGKLTAAHKTLPLGTKVRITNLQNGNTVEVEINDRGPYVGQRVIDLSHAAADILGFVDSGITLVSIELLTDDSETEEAG
jgi:rare lipoprotein A